MKWISVKSYLPEFGTPVLILTDYGKRDVCRLESGVIWRNDMRPQHSNGSVTHWMRLPSIEGVK